jgi:hypothetical protein
MVPCGPVAVLLLLAGCGKEYTCKEGSYTTDTDRLTAPWDGVGVLLDGARVCKSEPSGAVLLYHNRGDYKAVAGGITKAVEAKGWKVSSAKPPKDGAEPGMGEAGFVLEQTGQPLVEISVTGLNTNTWKGTPIQALMRYCQTRRPPSGPTYPACQYL